MRQSHLAPVCLALLVGACTFEIPSEIRDMSQTARGDDLGAPARDMRVVSADDAARDLSTPPVDMPRDSGMPDISSPVLDMPVEEMSTPDMPAPDMSGADMGPVDPIFIICDGQRVDITTDENHCGGCDISCEQGRGECVNKQCVCPWSGAKVCGEDGRCVDALYDPRHCGDCGVTCDVGETCDQGACVCRPGLTRCNGRCVDVLVDPFHCGQCDRDCGEGNRCKAGQCGQSSTCGAQYTPCYRDDRVACVKDTVEQESDLYCRPGRNFDVLCGDECRGNELCIEPNDLINPIQCRPYRPARTCDRCPCDECRGDELCRRQILGVQDVTYCVREP